MTAGPDVERLNAVNTALMLGSAAVAWIAPFELFLVVYAVLGPLHYLTEISWLHDRAYFTTRPHHVIVLIALAVLDLVARYTTLVPWNGAVVLAFGLAAAFVFGSGPRATAVLVAAAVGATLAAERWSAGWLFLVVLLPTIIHVFGFTGMFILHGTLRSRSRWGWVSLTVFLACGLGLLLHRPRAGQYAVSVRTASLVENFAPVIDELGALSGGPHSWAALAAIGRFLAFAYTYHYLNWFSKTGVIRWHTMPRRRMAAIGIVWAAAVALYAYDFRRGLVALLFLSLVHVLLEFPLDLRTMAGIVGRPAARAA